MPNVRDYGEYLAVLWGLWCQLRAAREQGEACHATSVALGRAPLFTAEQVAAFSNIMETVQTEGIEILNMGGARTLDGSIVPAMFGAWYAP